MQKITFFGVYGWAKIYITLGPRKDAHYAS
jgi:hypothetical protein